MEPEKIQTSLPENAYRELKPGEEYTPVMPASSNPKEVTPYSVTMGVVMAVVFSAAAAFLGLKVGQVFEAAIPIAIIAVGMGSVLGKKNMLGQNVIIQSIGASSGVIVAGAIFTLPALYILGLDAAFWQVFLSSLFGGLLGIVLLIPFRKYFVKEMHGKYPFPEATATTEVLVSGEKGGSQANAMAAVIQPLMTGGQTPWMLYFCGAALALVLTSIGVPALAFALGMFIPMELNAPLVVGGLVAWFVSGRSKDEGLNKARFDRGTLIASGFIAGGALMGVVSAVLKFVGVDWFLSGWASSNAAEWTGLAMYLVLIGYFAWHTLRAKKEE